MTDNFIHKQITSIIFGVASPSFIKKMSSAKIVTPELYDREGYPVDGGLMDVRLGVIDPGLKCKTCGSRLKECIGHFGYIELARPVIHIKFIAIMLKILKGTCSDCGRLRLAAEKITRLKAQLSKIKKEGNLDEYRAFTKKVLTSAKDQSKCPHCKVKLLTISLDKPTTFIESEKRISPIEIRTRLEKVSAEDLDLIGLKDEFIRPEWAVLTVLPIPPVTMRPSITLESGERSEDDLTHKLGDIVRINQRLFENINAGAPEIIIEDLWDLLQYHVTTFFDNSVAQLPPARHRSGQPLKTLTARVKSKEGRIRHNLAGKRTNFSARTVISPDPNLGLNEVGIPMEVANKLTVPERMTEWNATYLKKFIENGPKVYPGANYIIRPDGKKKKITDETKEQLLEEIQPGYLVERHLRDGDIVIFNRQPSLHRMSMMCHTARVLPFRTFRLNPAVCHPYNADFDGDEMNLHVPQSEEAMAEADILMKVETQLISPRYGLSVIGCIQDAISGAYLLTKFTEMPRERAIDLLYATGVSDFSRLANKKILTGNEIFSAMLPEDLNYNGTTLSGEDVVIKKGILEKGYMDSKSLGGEGKGLLLRHFHKVYGSDFTVDIIGKFLRLGIRTLEKTGLTVAISDTDLPPRAHEELNDIIKESNVKVNENIKLFMDGKMEALPGRDINETLELYIMEILNNARNSSGKVVDKYYTNTTGTTIMSRSGARGKSINLVQMAACVGQQALRGKRINKGYNGRSLSCFKSNDLGIEQHGFVKKGFSAGLNPAEFFFISMTGRDGLMDTALRTPKSGYLYRRLANAMQDLKVEYDDTVRDASGIIVQFKYGEDGIDVSKSEGGKINIKGMIERQ